MFQVPCLPSLKPRVRDSKLLEGVIHHPTANSKNFHGIHIGKDTFFFNGHFRIFFELSIKGIFYVLYVKKASSDGSTLSLKLIDKMRRSPFEMVNIRKVFFSPAFLSIPTGKIKKVPLQCFHLHGGFLNRFSSGDFHGKVFRVLRR